MWESLPGTITLWGTAVLTTAGVVTVAIKATRWGRKVVRAFARLLDIANEDEYPNGSTNLPQSLTEIYRRQGETHDLVQSHLEESKAQYAHHLEEWHGQTEHQDQPSPKLSGGKEKH